jgi:uncharacterized protein (DUF488 family)
MRIYTIGFTQTSAEDFFGRLADAGVRRVLDVRLSNTSQLAGFAKARDLPYFLTELVGADYAHEPLLAPTKELLDAYKKDGGSWQSYERDFMALMASRQIDQAIDPSDFATPTALLCSEPTAERCHRRLVCEYLAAHWPDLKATHL